jgi:hypothetical protein
MRKRRRTTMQRDQFLTEWLGECWYEWHTYYTDREDYKQHCSCGVVLTDRELIPHLEEFNKENYDFSTWPGFGKLWEAAHGDKQWENFLDQNNRGNFDYGIINTYLINPDRFAYAWAKFKGWMDQYREPDRYIGAEDDDGSL